MADGYPSNEAIERAEKSFTADGQRCAALCRELIRVARELEDADQVPDFPPDRLDELNARFLAISRDLKAHNCPPCNLP